MVCLNYCIISSFVLARTVFVCCNFSILWLWRRRLSVIIFILVLASSDIVGILFSGKFPYLLLMLFEMLVFGMLLVSIVVLVLVQKMLLVVAWYPPCLAVVIVACSFQ